MSLSSFLHIIKWFQVLLNKSHNLTSIICLHTVCSVWSIDRTLLGPTTPVKVDIGTMAAMKWYSTFPISPNHQIVYVKSRSLMRGGGAYPSAEMQSVYSAALAANWANNLPGVSTWRTLNASSYTSISDIWEWVTQWIPRQLSTGVDIWWIIEIA